MRIKGNRYRGLSVKVNRDVTRLLCSTCGAIPWKPVQTIPDGDLYCEQCCRAPYDGNMFKDRAVEREIRNLSVVCTNNDVGCRWKGELMKLFDHEMMCKSFNLCPCCDVSLTAACFTTHHEVCKGSKKANMYDMLFVAEKSCHYKDLSVLKLTDEVKALSNSISTQSSSGSNSVTNCMAIENVEKLIENGRSYRQCSERFHSDDWSESFQTFVEIQSNGVFWNFHFRVNRHQSEGDDNDYSTFEKRVNFEILKDGYTVLRRKSNFLITKGPLRSILTTGGRLIIKTIIED